MDILGVSPDDVQDVMEMTEKIEMYACNVLKDNDKTLALSALMSACVNTTLSQCRTFDEVQLYTNMFVQILDKGIESIRIKDSE